MPVEDILEAIRCLRNQRDKAETLALCVIADLRHYDSAAADKYVKKLAALLNTLDRVDIEET